MDFRVCRLLACLQGDVRHRAVAWVDSRVCRLLVFLQGDVRHREAAWEDCRVGLLAVVLHVDGVMVPAHPTDQWP